MRPEYRQKLIHETRDRVQGETVAVVTGEEMYGGIARGADFIGNGIDKILVIDEYHVVRRLVHALQKTVAAVIDAVQHMGEIIILIAPDSVFRRRRQDVICEFLGQDQRRFDFLQAEVLRATVEYFAVPGAYRHRCVGEVLHYRVRARMFEHHLLNVDLINHESVCIEVWRQVWISVLRPAVNTSLYVHCDHPWSQPYGRLSPCKSSVLTICYHPLSLRMIVLQICQEQIWTPEGCPKGVYQGRYTSKCLSKPATIIYAPVFC